MPINQNSIITIELLLKILLVLISTIGAIVSWFYANKGAKIIRHNKYNELIKNTEECLEKCLFSADKYWGSSKLSLEEKNTLGRNITYNFKQLSYNITRARKNFLDLIGDTDKLLEILNNFNKITSGNTFQSISEYNKTNITTIYDAADAVNKILSSKYWDK